jgi:hypothetical protein
MAESPKNSASAEFFNDLLGKLCTSSAVAPLSRIVTGQAARIVPIRACRREDSTLAYGERRLGNMPDMGLRRASRHNAIPAATRLVQLVQSFPSSGQAERRWSSGALTSASSTSKT